ncbi:MAG: D-sedoheptulose 7-phosphate isomerase [Saprospiraceae bacterium]
MQHIKNIIQESIDIKQTLLQDENLLHTIEEITAELTQLFKDGGKALFCGNGGSASDAQHLAAEFSGRFYLEREPLFAEALHVNTSFLTAVSNDYGYEEAYARMVRAAGRKGDMLFALSTSGNSPNIIRAIEDARKGGMKIVGMTGQTGGEMRDKCDWLLNVPSTNTPRIQEAHILLGHIVCEMVEKAVFS